MANQTTEPETLDTNENPLAIRHPRIVIRIPAHEVILRENEKFPTEWSLHGADQDNDD